MKCTQQRVVRAGGLLHCIPNIHKPGEEAAAHLLYAHTERAHRTQSRTGCSLLKCVCVLSTPGPFNRQVFAFKMCKMFKFATRKLN